MGGSSSDAVTENVVRYADYIEDYHEQLLQLSGQTRGLMATYNESPYLDYCLMDYDNAIYGVGYGVGSFPSLYDMFGKFMGGVDLEALYEEVLSDVYNNSAVEEMADAHRDLLDDDIEQTTLPRFRSGMRDINSVMSSTFIVGQAIIEQGRNKKLADYNARLQHTVFQMASEVFGSHLSWNQAVINAYLEILKAVVGVKAQENSMNYEILAKHTLWPFTVLAQHRANVACMTGAQTHTSTAEEAKVSAGTSAASGALSGAVSGATIGTSIKPGWGTLIGAVVGAVAGGLGGYYSAK
jgi:hypothetical protein